MDIRDKIMQFKSRPTFDFFGDPILPSKNVSLANKILLNALLKNSKLKVNINPYNEYLYKVYGKKYKDIKFDNLFLNNKKHFLSKLMYLQDDIKIYSNYDVSMLSITSEIQNINFVMKLLKQGNKVIIGGILLHSYSFEEIRNYLKWLGCTDNELKNLIIVNGYIDIDFDFYELWKNGVDYNSKNRDLHVEDIDLDLLYSSLSKVEKIENEYLSTIINMTCKWRKCKYCAYTRLPNIKFVFDEQKYIENVKKEIEIGKYKLIDFNDSWFIFDEYHKRVLDELKDYVEVGMMLGVKDLYDVDYCKNLNKYVDLMLIGIETCSDFSLQTMSRNYLWEDIDNCINNLCKYVTEPKKIMINNIMDLPKRNEADFIDAIQKYSDIKDRMEKVGHKVCFNIAHLRADSKSRIFKTPYYSYIDKSQLESIGCGEHKLMDMYSKVTGDEYYSYEPMYPYFCRYDENGKILESDLLLADKHIDIFEYMLENNKNFI